MGSAGFLDFGCMQANEPEAHKTSGRGTCVILCRSGAAGPAAARSVALAPPRELMGALERKGLTPLVCASRAEALAELVVHEREVRAGVSQRPMVLLLVEPEQAPGVVELIERVNRFAPHTMIWRYSPAHRPPLTAWAPSEPAAPSAAPRPAMQATVRPRQAPALRLTEAPTPREAQPAAPRSATSVPAIPDAPDAPDTQHKASQSPNGPILTQDELSMLLSDDWESHT